MIYSKPLKYRTSTVISTFLAFVTISCNSASTTAQRPSTEAELKAFRSAVILGKAKEVSEYLEKSPSFAFEKFEDGKTAIHIAASNKYTEIVGVLIPKLTSLEVQDDKGLTALHCAAVVGDAETVSLLLSKGANPNAKDNTGVTPVKVANAFGHKRVVEILKQHGGDF